jgi:ABC-type nickel/cobalt efflux system permease component RcnA
MNIQLRPGSVACSIALLIAFAIVAPAHPLGQYTINHFTRIETGTDRVKVRYVVDLAELATFPELQLADTDSSGSLSEAEMQAYLDRIVPQFLSALELTANGQPIQLQVVSKILSLPPGAANLATMRIECDLSGTVSLSGSTTLRFRFADTNHREKQGWHELVVVPAPGHAIYDSTAWGSGITDELKAYPEDLLMAPLNERAVEWSVAVGAAPAGAKPLQTRDGKPLVTRRDRFAELITVQTITPGFALFALLFAFGLGAVHALSPGHGKALVGAYLVGSKGTPKHAVFLGLTVTITHTIGVFALGLVFLFAAQYGATEKIYPLLALASGLAVLIVGLSLFVSRLRAALGLNNHVHAQEHDHDHSHEFVHSHDGRTHTHLPPERVTWRSLLTLGISGGLVPCPSALVVMLAAIAAHRVGFGLLLVTVFSFGLAVVLTVIGLIFLYAGKLIDRTAGSNPLIRALPVVSAFIISCIGAALCYSALQEAGLKFSSLFSQPMEAQSLIYILGILGAGLVLGLQHATDADHLAAVTSLVSERKSIFSSWLVGGLWGIGHTISLLIAGVAVILLNFQISERLELALEFCVGLMLIGLGANALIKLARGGRIHLHTHTHSGHTHAHLHMHDRKSEHEEGTHHGFRPGARPLLVGMMHGLAGSAAVMLLVLQTIPSPLVGLIYIAVFGVGSIGGMMLMSALLSLPMYFTADRFVRADWMLRALAGLFSVGFGLYMVYEKGFHEGLLR